MLNQFLKLRFFEARDRYAGRLFVMREATTLVFRESGSIDGREAHLTLRLGDRNKTVTLYESYPVELGQLRGQIDRIGGPTAWPGK